MGLSVDPGALFELPEGARVPRRRRPPRSGGADRGLHRFVPMPEPRLPERPAVADSDAPLLHGMEEVGAGLLDRLDAMQRVAASAPPGPLLINAGPGTGKTHTLVMRVAYAITDLHIPASQCLVLAATDHAARSIRRELGTLIDRQADEVTVASFGEFTSRTGKQRGEFAGQVAQADPPPLGYLFVDDLQRMPAGLYARLCADRGEQPAFTATGDPDSALDAESTVFDRFTADYPEARMVRLARNHRSPAAMLVAAAQLIEPVTRVPGRHVHPQRPALESAKIGRFFADSPAHELQFLDELIARLADLGVARDEIGVLRADAAVVPGSMTVSESADRDFRVVCCLGVDAIDWPDTRLGRRALYLALSRARELAYVSHVGDSSPLLDDIDQGLFTRFGRVADRGPRLEQPRLL